MGSSPDCLSFTGRRACRKRHFIDIMHIFDYDWGMAITTKFGQAVIGSAEDDAVQTLIQIHRPDINVVSAYRPQDPAIEKYLLGLDIENRYMQPTEEDRHPEYGVSPAFFFYCARTDELSINADLPEGEGRDVFLKHLKAGAALYSDVTGFDDVQVMWRVIGQSKAGLVCHIDNDVTLRGLETILGANRTLWLPDQAIDWNQFRCEYDHHGKLTGNGLCATFKEHSQLEEIDHHHMSIHKGGAFSNPLMHTAAGLCPELKMNPGTRSIVTYDHAFQRD